MSMPPMTPSEQEAHRLRREKEIQDRIEELGRQFEQLIKEVKYVPRFTGSESQGSEKSSAAPIPGVPGWLAPILQGVTLLAIIGCAFWLGTLSSTVTHNSTKLDTVYTAVLESKDSLSSRTTAIETRLENIEKKLDQLATSPPRR